MTDKRLALENRRLLARICFAQGHSVSWIQRYMRVSSTTAYRWWHRFLCGDDMHARKTSGRPPRRTQTQTEKIKDLYCDGMTCKAFAVAIERYIGIKYHPDHVCKLTWKLGLREKHKRAHNG